MPSRSTSGWSAVTGIKDGFCRSTAISLVGRRPASGVVRLAALDRAITVTGEVPDPAEYIARATVCISPVQIGAGMQNKLIEYMACGKAVVTTPVANEGINAISGTHLLEAAGPEAFADAVVALLRNPEMRAALGKSAREHIQRYWTWEKLFSALESEMLAMARGSQVVQLHALEYVTQSFAG